MLSEGYVVAIALAVLLALRHAFGPSQLRHIPACGPTAPLLSYLGSLWFFFDATGVLEYGYHKFSNRVFKVAHLNRWMVVVASPELIEDLRRAPEDVLSFQEGVSEVLQIPFTVGEAISRNPYHTRIIRNRITKSLASTLPETHDEVVAACSDIFHFDSDDWVSFPAMESVMRIVARASNRLFVGLPLCRNEEFLHLNTQFTVDVASAATVIGLCPLLIRPYVARLFPSIPKSLQKAAQLLEPVITERRCVADNINPDFSGNPPDILGWILEEAQGDERSLQNLARRILTINFAAIHTTSLTFVHALYHLAAEPKYLQPLREEIESVVAEEGWTYAAMKRMKRLDSFLKESQRLNPLGGLLMIRKALKPFSFSDGTTIPAGTFVSVAATPIHCDKKRYENPLGFDGFRFSDGTNNRTSMVTTSPWFLSFGHGKNACPGRFFAASELRIMLAHLVLTYDIQLPQGKERPRNTWIASTCIPDPYGRVSFRKRSNF
ncbi:cytochrome P450 [Armillaria gallica]|uniref:Cytochrome P450 n=1 Tax=Armillaria gallica TaxID=47427 RepID=A0A2H3DVC2_ARMGA|nr:cytochrome P450 [Armillaria gallica]